MKLVNPDYFMDIDLIECRHNVFLIEAPEIYAKLLGNLWSQYNAGDSNFVLSEAGKVIKFDKYVSLVYNPFGISLSDKVIVSALYKELSIYTQENLYEQLTSINSEIIKLIDKVSLSVPYPLSCNLMLTPEDLFKLYKMSIEDESESFAESISVYIKILSRLCKFKLVIFVNLSSFVTTDELRLIYETADYEKIHLLLLENKEREWLSSENVDILDEDFCIIKLY